MIKKTIASLLSDYPGFYLRRLVGRANSIATHTTSGERVCLFRSAAAACELGCAIEVGSYLGASSVVIAEAIKRKASDKVEPVLYCIDTWNNHAMTEGIRDTWSDFVGNTSSWQDVIRPIRGDSRNVQVPVTQCDFVFIDADHTYEGVTQDIEKFAPLVRPGGRLLLHDHAYYAGVARAVGDLLVSGKWCITILSGNLVGLTKNAEWMQDTNAVPAGPISANQQSADETKTSEYRPPVYLEAAESEKA